MPHHKECVEADSDRDAKFVMSDRLHSGQPASLSRVQQQEDHIVLFDKLFQLHRRVEKFLVLGRIRANRVAWHGDSHHHALCVDVWVDFLESLSSNRSLEIILLLTVLKGEKALPYRVAKRNAPRIDEGNLLSVAPCK